MSSNGLLTVFTLLLLHQFLIQYGVESKRTLPDFVKQCHRSASEAELKVCMAENIVLLSPHLAKGIPEMHIPPLDPFHIERVSLTTTSNFLAALVNATLVGGANFRAVEPALNAQTFSLNFTLLFPALRLEGSYELIGTLLLMRLDSSGSAWVNLTNLEVRIEGNGDERVENGSVYIDVSDRRKNKVKLTFHDDPLIHLENLFQGNAEMTRALNVAINSNIMLRVNLLLPLIEEVIDSVAFTLVQGVFETFSVDELFAP